MSNFIGKVLGGITHDIGSAVSGVAKGIGDVAKGGLKFAEGALTLDPKKAFSGAVEAGGGALSTAKNAFELTPEGLESSAANNLLDGAVSTLTGNNG